jgi:hypothetical protein
VDVFLEPSVFKNQYGADWDKHVVRDPAWYWLVSLDLKLSCKLAMSQVSTEVLSTFMFSVRDKFHEPLCELFIVYFETRQ